MATFVLIHGACHGGWCWERVKPLLEAKGHRVLAPDLPGMGQDKTPQETVTADLWAKFVVDLMAAQSEPVVLVGHSRGGMQITAAAEAAPELVRKLVYLSAFVPVDGGTNIELAMQYCSSDLLSSAGQAQESDGAAFPPDLAKKVFYNTTEDSWAARAAGLLCPEPPQPSMSQAHVTAERFGKVRKAYIECLEDNALTLAGQRAMQKHAVFETVIQMPTDHSPFYSAPEKLADALASLAD
jgi:pimeloyl-ACP methyl ester carboxylesterase